MSEKYVKIQSQQNGDFTATNNRVDYLIPSSMGKVSLKDSFIQMYCRVDAVEADVASGTGVYMSSLKWNNERIKKDSNSSKLFKSRSFFTRVENSLYNFF